MPLLKFKIKSYIYPFGFKTKEDADPVSNFGANGGRRDLSMIILSGILMHSVVFDDKSAWNIVQLGMF